LSLFLLRVTPGSSAFFPSPPAVPVEHMVEIVICDLLIVNDFCHMEDATSSELYSSALQRMDGGALVFYPH
jgi:hypothetical protein